MPVPVTFSRHANIWALSSHNLQYSNHESMHVYSLATSFRTAVSRASATHLKLSCPVRPDVTAADDRAVSPSEPVDARAEMLCRSTGGRGGTASTTTTAWQSSDRAGSRSNAAETEEKWWLKGRENKHRNLIVLFDYFKILRCHVELPLGKNEPLRYLVGFGPMYVYLCRKAGLAVPTHCNVAQ